jgi:protein gp37
MHPAWARDLRDQCTDAGVPFFFKQWGAWAPILDRDKDDPDWRREYSNALAEGPDRRWLNLDGGRGFHGERFHVMARVGKKAAGRLLDGREWSEMPAAPAAQRQPAETTA